ncbi:large ribosomal subunit protein uL15m-like [Macrobrachium nipponense]|uniref:large ribosomal subunit protein uL15m-like n=1 Tax=Macrobrachium nipponense TaxID=159736 RepID=UPI0030C8AA06
MSSGTGTEKALSLLRRLPSSFIVKSEIKSRCHKKCSMKLSYKTLCMGNLQKMIDTSRLRTDIPIDVTQIANTKLFEIKAVEKEGGIMLENDKARINIEVQWASEAVIAAVERNGGFITTAYYDFIALDAAVNPANFFKKGVPIPRRMIPPQHLIGYYTDPKNRGYLADPALIAKERFILAQKYGYKLPDVNDSPDKDMLLERKDPRQVFFGLEPGWIVNLRDKVILKPTDPELKEYYAS